MDLITCKVDNQGRITLPAEWRRAQKVEAGIEVVVTSDECGLFVQTKQQALHEAQTIIAKYPKPAKPAVVQLLTARRQEAQREAHRPGHHGKSLR
jgi:bifunctional DNA-binding transcriptional regulator/antitoxin component of YhaV-PrlF toxin-antitoxin module